MTDTRAQGTADEQAREKKQLRSAARQRRAERPSAEQAAFAQRLAAAASQPPLSSAERVALFIGVDAEPQTLPLVESLAARGCEVLLPVVLPDFDLEWGRFVSVDDLQRSRHGLLEPAPPYLGTEAVGTADVVVVPAFAIDPDGRRLGQGGGCYDRALRRVAAATPVLAVLFDDEVRSTPLPEEPHDRRVTGRLAAG